MAENKDKKLENISGIPFEDEGSEAGVLNLRMGCRTPTNFRQDKLINLYGNLLDTAKNVLEIGCGCGRNAQYFVDSNINYFGFDSSKVSLKYFENNSIWGLKNKNLNYYISNNIDEKILSQKYDLIFSTFVLQHIGVRPDADIHDSITISKLLFPLLNINSYWMAYELYHGQNNWNPDRWLDQSFDKEKISIKHNAEISLEGSEGPDHRLVVFQKLSD